MARVKTTERAATAEDCASKTPVRKPAVTNDMVARRAYSLYLERGGEDGHDVEDWLQALHELRVDAEGSDD